MTVSLFEKEGIESTKIPPPCFGRRIKFSGAYTITHSETGQAYVGSSGDLYQRKNQHEHMLRAGKHDCKQLQDLFNQSPSVEFDFSLAEDREAALDLEQKIVSTYVDSGVLLNTAIDVRSTGKGLTRSPEAIEKNRQAHLGKALTEDHRRKISEGSRSAELTGRSVSINGTEYRTLVAAAEALGIPKTTVSNRIKSPNARFAEWKDS